MPRTDKNKKSIYLNQVFGFTDSFSHKIQQLVLEENLGKMQISPHEARILQFLVQLCKARKVVEIGTLYAYSAFHIACALPEEGLIWTLDKSPQRHKKAKEILKDSSIYKKINWVCGEALNSLKSLSSQAPFDMVFIDADKGAYLDYLDWTEKNLKPGGLFVADNTVLCGAVYGES